MLRLSQYYTLGILRVMRLTCIEEVDWGIFTCPLIFETPR